MVPPNLYLCCNRRAILLVAPEILSYRPSCSREPLPASSIFRYTSGGLCLHFDLLLQLVEPCRASKLGLDVI